MKLRNVVIRQLTYSFLSTCLLVFIVMLCKELKRKRRLKNRRKLLVVLDFDETITRRHVGVTPIEELTSNEIRGNVSDSRFLVEFLVLAKKMGYFLAVASFSDDQEIEGGVAGVSLIKTYLREIFKPLDYSDFISPEMIESWHPEYGNLNQPNPNDSMFVGKSAHISNIIKKIGCHIPPSDVILIDDCQQNVRLAQASGYNAYCCSENGFTREFLSTSLSLQQLLGMRMGSPK